MGGPGRSLPLRAVPHGAQASAWEKKSHEPPWLRDDTRRGVGPPLATVAGGRRVRRALAVGGGATAPTTTELAEARDAVRAAVVELEGDVAQCPSAHTQLDFGGIGVGYGIDRALEVIRARGLRRAFIDVSGDMGAIGAPPGESGWLVEIADPDRAGAGRPVTATRLRDAALATAANTESGVRYGSLVAGHVMNPATGWPAHALRQASVVTSTAVAADALSTAMLVTGRRPAGGLQADGGRAPGSPGLGPGVVGTPGQTDPRRGAGGAGGAPG